MTTFNQPSTTPDASASSDLAAQSIVIQLLQHSPLAVTYAAIEQAISAAGHDPLDAQDLYLQVLQGLDDAGVPAVERLETPGSGSTIDDEAMELADEVVAQLQKTRRNTNQFNHALLSAADERRLLEIYRDGRRASAELGQEMSGKQRLACERRIAAGDAALDQLVSHNVRLVAASAYKVAAQTAHLDAEDLIQEGMIGLHRAIELYRLDFGHRLSTYASYWIRQAISRAVADQDRMVRLPVHMIESLGALRRATRQLTTDLGHTPTDEELAAATGNSIARVHQLQLLSRQHLSLDLPMSAQGEATLGDLLPDTRMLEPETALIERSRREAIWKLIANNTDLSEVERQVVSMRFGLADGERQTLQQIGDRFNVTRERVRQLEVRALKKLQINAKRVQLKSYLED